MDLTKFHNTLLPPSAKDRARGMPGIFMYLMEKIGELALSPARAGEA